MKAVILVGGEGTRLRPLTYCLPKAIVPIVNQPLMAYMLNWLKSGGVKEALLIACYLPDKLKKALGNSVSGIKIRYIYEDKPLGTGGAIKRAEKFMGGTTVVMNGDVILSLDLKKMLKFHRSNKSNLTISLTPVENPSAYGVVETDKSGRITRFLEKPSPEEITVKPANINAGVYFMEPSVLELMEPGKVYSIERDVFPKMIDRNAYGFIQKNMYWIDVGTAEKYKKINYDILGRKIKVKTSGLFGRNLKTGKGAKVGKKTSIGNNNFIGDKVSIKDYSVVGNNCRIDKGSVLDKCILWNNITVGEGCVLKGCIIANNSKIGEFSKLSESAVIAQNSSIAPRSKL